MLVITAIDETGRLVDLEWHVGEKSPTMRLGEITSRELEAVVAVTADGHELEYIKQNFTNIPMVANRTIVVWTGNLAQFISWNL